MATGLPLAPVEPVLVVAMLVLGAQTLVEPMLVLAGRVLVGPMLVSVGQVSMVSRN
jgi:hypothetical protein